MKNNKLIIILCLCLGFVHAQDILRIEYEMKYFNPIPEGRNTDADFKLAANTFNDMIYDYELFIKGNQTLWKRIPHLREEGVVIIGDQHYFFTPPDDRTYLSNFEKNTLIYPHYKGKEGFVETIATANWQLERTESNFIGYKVYKATIPDANDAEIYALYTPEIQSKAGPWRSNGLPGLILYYKETYPDGFSIEFKANKIENFDKKVDFELFKDYTIMTREEFQKKMQERKEKFGEDYGRGVDTSD
ncbi:MAG: GLPGLI family protein [Flavobacteriaceae bacterium]|nr:GLPGLI family protein [Flavobacteriaceae bacterium]